MILDEFIARALFIPIYDVVVMTHMWVTQETQKLIIFMIYARAKPSVPVFARRTNGQIAKVIWADPEPDGNIIRGKSAKNAPSLNR